MKMCVQLRFCCLFVGLVSASAFRFHQFGRVTSALQTKCGRSQRTAYSTRQLRQQLYMTAEDTIPPLSETNPLLFSILKEIGFAAENEEKVRPIVIQNNICSLRIETWKNDDDENDDDDHDDRLDRPLLLWLPSLDGRSITARGQFPQLAKVFSLKTLQMDKNDRSSFENILDFCLHYLKSRIMERRKRHVIVGGESFGALLALGIALKNPSLIQGVVAVNPATSYSSTAWPILGSAIASVADLVPPVAANPSTTTSSSDDTATGAAAIPAAATAAPAIGELAYAAIGAPVLLAAGLDHQQIGRLAGAALERLQSTVPSAAPWALGSAAATAADDTRRLLEEVLDVMPPATLRHRLAEQVAPGAQWVNARLENLTMPVLVIAGTADRLLPSGDEARRLQLEIPVCSLIRVPGAGHAPLDGRVNLTAMILDSAVVPRRLRKDWVREWTMPPAALLRAAAEAIEPLRRATSPVFFSTAAGGRVVRGLGEVPERRLGGRPVLFVGNHQLLALDLGVLMLQWIEERGILPRGLAHPSLFEGGLAGAGRVGLPGLPGPESFTPEVFRAVGAVPVSPASAHRLFAAGEAVLLFPGGGREMFHRPGEADRLFWPEPGGGGGGGGRRADFVRLAARFDAVIVPFGGIGAADMVRFLPPPLADAFGAAARLATGSVGGSGAAAAAAARRWGTAGLNADRLEISEPPAVLLRPPWEAPRLYFLFGEPIDTAAVDHGDAAAVSRLYERVHRGVEGCIGTLKKGRARDPYAAPAPRMVYETLTGRPAPTFDPLSLR